MIRVLFVCLGNICRSPIGEGSFRAQVMRAGLSASFEIASAGTAGYHAGEPPDPRSVAVARRHGVDIAQQRAAQVNATTLRSYDEVLAMDTRNLSDLRRLIPQGAARPRLGLLLDELEGPRGREVPDPYYGGSRGFDEVWALVDQATAALLQRLIREHKLEGKGR
ncbi:low molecular weight phosphotyrosine protein phosphatase [Myxococcota bacterium]|nr:low molecular weight phosphotyrosine protein phosphatase [Myxococcota bacterium]MBU1430477.1 low molecular weight phosphotyrosine protein phosphatase [Myxococcota bacterium]MBU1900063.1 low molecular weight phosphotyrosine protein phosphatase [Myxococcota bacterium]